MRHPKRKLMVVVWMDHFGKNGWHMVEPTDLEPLFVRSVGWVLAEDDTMVSLVNGEGHTGRALDSISILKCAIVEQYEIVF